VIRLEHTGTRLCDGLSRRELLRIGALGPLALSLPGLLATRAEAEAPAPIGSFGKAKGCIQIFLWGGPGAQETWDLKPEAPTETRGAFRPIHTSVPGTLICEHLPLLARRAHRYALLRSVTHTGVNHGTSAYHMLTGHIHFSPGTLRHPTKRDMPNIAANASRLLRHPAHLPGVVAIPHPIVDGDGGDVPGQTAGILGDAYEPFRVTGDLTQPEFRPSSLKLVDGVDGSRLRRRARLQEAVAGRAEFLEGTDTGRSVDLFYRKALDLLTSTETYRAFDLSAEPAALRDRYGRNTFGQSLALARRLVETGVPLVTVYWNNPSLEDDGNWDTHADQHRRLKDHILPPFDRALSSLLDDLHERGMLDSTLVTWYGEFGRTPKINRNGGRDHWGFCQSIGMAGGGVRGGTLFGSSTADGGYPASEPVSPDDVAATMFHCLGVDHRAHMYDLEQRPLPLSYGEVIRPIVG
jgi:hypothetical protein